MAESPRPSVAEVPERKIKFTRDYEVQDGTGTSFKAGKTERLPEPSAMHFVNRGAAEFVD